MGRATQGVTLIQLDEGEKLAGLEKIAEAGADDANGNGAPDGDPANGGGDEGDAPAADGDAGPPGTLH